MQALDRKLLRDLRQMGSQALTIALVIASGIGGFVACLSAVDSLAAARESFYESARFAEVFVSLKRAPDSLAQTLRTLPGISAVQTTVETVARVSMPASTDPVLGQFIGLDIGPDGARPATLNRVGLRSGRWPQGNAAELQAVVSEGFASAHGLKAGSAVQALINGRQRLVRITGIALSPEYIFAGLWGMPDARGFGVFWVDQPLLAALLDMTGAFNRVAFRLSAGTQAAALLDAIDRQLLRVGGLPAVERSEQISHAMLDNEIREQTTLGTLLPSIFLAVAAFLIHVVVARLIATQREQVAALKALGYSNRSIALHYLKLVAPIVLLGYVLGLLLGQWMGRLITGLYAEVFHFPTFAHRVAPGLMLISLAVLLVTLLLGTLTAIAATVRLSPAEAMRPASPGRYRPSLLERLPGVAATPALRMVLRNIERRPLRSGLTAIGMAAAVAIIVLGNFFRDAIEVIVEASFEVGLRSELLLWTTEPVDAAAARLLARLPGVQQVEVARSVAVRLVHGQHSKSVALQGYVAQPQLMRIIDLELQAVAPPSDGLMLSERLANKLGLRIGDSVTVEIREGQRRTRQVVLQRTVRDMMGLNAFMELQALHRLLGEGDVAGQFALAVQGRALDDVLKASLAMPRVAGAFSKATLLRNMQEITARNILIMSALLTGFAAVIAIGVVYNSARIALAERSWELASLRVLGFSRAEVSVLLLGELALMMALALPLGMAMGWALTHLLVDLLRSDQFEFPVTIRARTYAGAALCVLLAGLASALLVRRRIDRLDLVAALKTRE